MFELPDLVVFDLDNTIYEYAPCNKIAQSHLSEYLSELYGMSGSELNKSLAAARKLVKKRIEGASSHSRHLYISEFLHTRGIKLDPNTLLEAAERYWSAFLSKMQLAPGVIDLLTSLRYRQIPIALVSDLTLEIQYRKLVRLGVDSFFDFIVVSEETTLDKQSGRPFDLLIERLNGREYKSVWFIGDSESDFPRNFPASSIKYILSPFSNVKKTQQLENIKSFKDLSRLIR